MSTPAVRRTDETCTACTPDKICPSCDTSAAASTSGCHVKLPPTEPVPHAVLDPEHDFHPPLPEPPPPATPYPPMQAESYQFNADISQLMSLIINTFYSNKEIFLRELISNASDALDKIRYAGMLDSKELETEPELRIRLYPNKQDGTLTVMDTGIGMTKAELIQNLGTIARSGTKAFMEAITAGADLSMIGQFGVGSVHETTTEETQQASNLLSAFPHPIASFIVVSLCYVCTLVSFYAAFLVAERVQVHTKHNEDEQWVWQSAAGGEFTVGRDPNYPRITRGTHIILYLKEDQKQTWTSERPIRDTVKRHSEFIQYPIQLRVEKEVEEEAETKEEKEGQGSEGGRVEDVTEDENRKKEGGRKRKVVEWETLNTTKPSTQHSTHDALVSFYSQHSCQSTRSLTRSICLSFVVRALISIWRENPQEVKEEAYDKLYKTLSADWEGPLAWKHFKVEGQIEFSSVLFAPRRAPFDLFTSSADKKKQNNLRLYVRRVFVTDDCNSFCPEWLSFLKGLVDSEDLPLNISREALQVNRILAVIKKSVVKKALEMFGELSDDADKYRTFYEQFSKNIKLGLHEDSANSVKLAELLRFYSSASGDQWTSLKEYVSRMKPGQQHIYYLTAETREQCAHSPFLEGLRDRGYEVIFFTDPLDEATTHITHRSALQKQPRGCSPAVLPCWLCCVQYMVQQLKEYDGKKLRDASKEKLELLESDEEKREEEEERKAFEATLKKVKEVLGDKVEAVTVSHRITRSPCVLVTGEFGWSANMERIMKAQALRDTSLSSFMVSKKTMELNPHHKIVQALKQRIEEGPSNERTVRDLVWLLYDTALLVSGFSLPDPVAYANRIHKILAAGLGVEWEGEGEQQQKEAGGRQAVAEAERARKDDMPPLVDEEQQATVMEEVD